MLRLIDIAGRTGLAPVRALLAEAIGTTDPGVLQPHEIRYRNDQHHVLYGLYDDDRIVGLIGLARFPAEDRVDIHHFSIAPGSPGTADELLHRIVERHPDMAVRWHVPPAFERQANAAGFRADSSDAGQAWIRRDAG